MSEDKKPVILLVDDDPDILEMISYNLIKEGYNVHTASNGEEGVQLADKVNPDLVLLDVMMPKMDGIEVCEIIREKKQTDQPIIAFLTSRAEDYSQIAGFKAGGDDYITKPIRPRVLLSRIEALLRRKYSKEQDSQPEPVSTRVMLDRERFLLLLEDKEIILPKKEFELLELLLSKPGKVFTREEILSKVWGDETIVGERTIDVHIRKLREKIGDAYIRTIKGVGYTYNEV
ncbi:MAG: response regulator transcription factor [Brumimicrobium sp.]|nr:response regulator transcription factor [Brumimicrobium sp.]